MPCTRRLVPAESAAQPAWCQAPQVPSSDAMHGKGNVPVCMADSQGDVPVCMAEPLIPLHSHSVPTSHAQLSMPMPYPVLAHAHARHPFHAMHAPAIPGAGACLQVIDDSGYRLARELGAFLHEQLLQRLHCRSFLSLAEDCQREMSSTARLPVSKENKVSRYGPNTTVKGLRLLLCGRGACFAAREKRWPCVSESIAALSCRTVHTGRILYRIRRSRYLDRATIKP